MMKIQRFFRHCKKHGWDIKTSKITPFILFSLALKRLSGTAFSSRFQVFLICCFFGLHGVLPHHNGCSTPKSTEAHWPASVSDSHGGSPGFEHDWGLEVSCETTCKGSVFSTLNCLSCILQCFCIRTKTCSHAHTLTCRTPFILKPG
jgi:hypothetical protein